MNPNELLCFAAQALERVGVEYVVAGSVASMYYGEVRGTHGADIVVKLREDQVYALKSCFPEKDFYFEETMALDAVRQKRMFNVIHIPSALKIDFVVSKGQPFDKRQFQRRRHLPVIADQKAYFASPEDVILAKLDFYKKGSSDKHLRDVAGILKISGDEVDRAYVSEWAERLEVTDVWEAVLQRLEQPARASGKGEKGA